MIISVVARERGPKCRQRITETLTSSTHKKARRCRETEDTRDEDFKIKQDTKSGGTRGTGVGRGGDGTRGTGVGGVTRRTGVGRGGYGTRGTNSPASKLTRVKQCESSLLFWSEYSMKESQQSALLEVKRIFSPYIYRPSYVFQAVAAWRGKSAGLMFDTCDIYSTRGKHKAEFLR